MQNTLLFPCTEHLPFFFEENCNLYLHLLMAVKDMRIGMNIHSIHREQAILSVFCVHHRNCAAKPAKLSMDSAEIEQRFRVN